LTSTVSEDGDTLSKRYFALYLQLFCVKSFSFCCGGLLQSAHICPIDWEAEAADDQHLHTVRQHSSSTSTHLQQVQSPGEACAIIDVESG